MFETIANMSDIRIQYKIIWSEKRAALEKPVYVKIVQWVYTATASKTLCNISEDYKFLSSVKGRDKRLKVNDYLIHEKDSASWSKIILRVNKNDKIYSGADKSLARPTFRCILFDDENISFDASLVIRVYI